MSSSTFKHNNSVTTVDIEWYRVPDGGCRIEFQLVAAECLNSVHRFYFQFCSFPATSSFVHHFCFYNITEKTFVSENMLHYWAFFDSWIVELFRVDCQHCRSLLLATSA